MWYNILASFFKKHEFVFLNANFNVFFNEKLIIVIYVDDILLIDFNSRYIAAVKQIFNEYFKIIDLNLFRFYLYINIKRNRSNRILFLNQKIYLKKIFKNHDMWKCKSIAIFINNNVLKVIDLDYVVIVEQRHVYQSVVDFLMYVMLKTRFNLVYAVFVISRNTRCSTSEYVFNVKNEVINWSFKRPSIVTFSTYEAEYIS